ncbi:MAG: hypothetical protein Q9165_000610 [Trypethelium subeluteriae]
MLCRQPPYLRLANYRQWQFITYLPKSTGLQFHSSARVHQNDNPPNHYETLDLSPDASPSDIKKYTKSLPSPTSPPAKNLSPLTSPPFPSNRQFYTLSKRHHPDLHPHDPDASPRFVAITTAYTTLSDPTSRRHYDASLFPASSSPSSASRTGSFSSASASANSSPAGGRPASGLSKRRGTFRGPPPSFYRSGGWGAASAKRRANAGFRHGGGGEGEGSAGGTSSSSSAGGGDAGLGGGGGYMGSTEGGTYAGAGGAFGAGSFSGFAGGAGAGGNGGGVDDEVPHFDRAGHFRTQQKVEGHRNRRGPVDAWGNEIGGTGGGSGSLLMSFLVLTGVIAGCVMIPNLVMGAGSRTRGNGGEGRRKGN